MAETSVYYGKDITVHDPGCQCHAVPCRTARGLIVDGVDLVPMHPAPQPPAAEGWIPLTDWCAMPKNGATVDVTIGNEEDARWVERCSYLPSANTAPGQYGFDVDLYEGEFLTAWRPAPAPYREAK